MANLPIKSYFDLNDSIEPNLLSKYALKKLKVFSRIATGFASVVQKFYEQNLSHFLQNF